MVAFQRNSIAHEYRRRPVQVRTDWSKAQERPAEAKQNYNCFLPQLLSTGLNAVLNYAPMIVGSFSETPQESEIVVEEDETSATQKESAEEVITEALKKIGIDYESKDASFKYDLKHKYNTMLCIAEKSGEKLSSDIIALRLQNYAKGREFFNFELEAYDDDSKEIKYTAPETTDVEEKKAALKEHYSDLTNAYFEFYNQDNNDYLDLYEAVLPQLQKYYENEGNTKKDALELALDKISELKDYSFEEINNYNGDDEGINFLKECMVLFGTLEEDKNSFENIQELSKDEILTYIMMKSKALDDHPTITATESTELERVIYEEVSDKEKTAFENLLNNTKDFKVLLGL